MSCGGNIPMSQAGGRSKRSKKYRGGEEMRMEGGMPIVGGTKYGGAAEDMEGGNADLTQAYGSGVTPQQGGMMTPPSGGGRYRRVTRRKGHARKSRMRKTSAGGGKKRRRSGKKRSSKRKY